MPYIDLGRGQEIFYSEEGAGDPALFIHGWCCDGSDWAWLVSALRRDYRCIMIDNRGHGRSSPMTDGYTPRLFAADTARVIEELGIQTPIVFAHSMGALIASMLAVERPDLVQALILIDPGMGARDEMVEPFIRAIREDPIRVATDMFSPDSAAPAHSANFYTSLTPAWLPIWHRRRMLGLDRAVIRDAFIGQFDGDGGIALRSIAERHLRRRQTPTLTVYAGRSTAVAQWDRTLHHSPLDHIVMWPEHGHFLHQEDPERLAHEVRKWLETLRR